MSKVRDFLDQDSSVKGCAIAASIAAVFVFIIGASVFEIAATPSAATVAVMSRWSALYAAFVLAVTFGAAIFAVTVWLHIIGQRKERDAIARAAQFDPLRSERTRTPS